MRMSMLFTKSSNVVLILTGFLILQGCQSVDDNLENNKSQQIEPVRMLTPMEKIHQSPNLYLVSNPVVTTLVTTQFDLAKEAVKNKEWVIANKTLLDLTIAAPTLSGPWLLLGDVAKVENDVAHAIAHYQQAIYVNEHNYFARNRLAAMLRAQGDYVGAREQYQKAIISWPAFTNAHRNYGVLLDLYIGEADNGLKQYEIVAALDALNNLPVDRKLKGWIADLSRRVSAIKKAAAREQAKKDAQEVPIATQKISDKGQL
jgi:tetratricopeptide (TPR) repeat protein